jgi:hypothetical protein
MRESQGTRPAWSRRCVLFILWMALTTTGLGLANTALAAPKGIFSVFSECPTSTSSVVLCQYARNTSGELAIGSLVVPITEPGTLQSGLASTENPENRKEYFYVPAKDGNTLSKTEESIPGGLGSVVDCEAIMGERVLETLERRICMAILKTKEPKATAIAELVATAENPAILDIRAFAREEGVANTLPIRIHLKGGLLGPHCYIGSTTDPIELQLTTGTTSPPPPNSPIHGALGSPSILEEGGLLLSHDVEYRAVDNAFSVPVADGCGGPFSTLIDQAVDARIGLPSSAGHNTVVFNGESWTATAEVVIASEAF